MTVKLKHALVTVSLLRIIAKLITECCRIWIGPSNKLHFHNCAARRRGVWTGSQSRWCVCVCMSVCVFERERESVCVCVERERERESAHSRLAQAQVRENGALCTAAAWLRLTGEATCGLQTGWQVYRRACTLSRSPTWLFPVGVSLRYPSVIWWGVCLFIRARIASIYLSQRIRNK